MTTSQTMLLLRKENNSYVTSVWNGNFHLLAKPRRGLFLTVQMSEPVSPLPEGRSAVATELHVSLLKLQGPCLMADWQVFAEFSCWPRGTWHLGNNVSKL